MTHSPSPSAMRHRWMLVVPLVLVLVVATILDGRMRSQAMLLPSSLEGWSGGELQVASGTVIAVEGEDLLFTQGAVLLWSRSLTTVRVDTWEVTVWGGGAYITRQGTVPVIAALDIPLIVRGPSGTAVVPPGTQWRAPIEMLPPIAADPARWKIALQLEPVPAAFVRDKEQVLETWRSAESPRAEVPPLTAALLADAPTSMIAAWALAEPSSPLLAEAVHARAELRLAGLLHPVFRDAAWAFLPEHSIDEDTLWAALLFLPSVERKSVQTSPLTVHKWGDALEAALQRAPDPPALASAILPVLEASMRHIADDGYPLRALRFTDALMRAVPSGSGLTLPAQAAWDRVERMTPDSLRASALSDIAIPLKSTPPSGRAPLQDPALEQRAREQLVAHGGMLTAETVIRTAGEGMVDVRDVVFGFRTGDRMLHFLYRTADDTVQAIQGGVLLPNLMPFDAYMEWEAGQAGSS